jgi:flagellar biosynthetic protein FliR
MIPFNFNLADMFGFFLVLGRLLGMVSIVPIFSQKEIIPQSKISLLLALTIFTYPLVKDVLPTTGGHITLFFYFFLIEILIGFFIGLISKMLFMVLDFLGAIIGMQSGLSNAMVFNPSIGTQAILPSVFLSLAGTLLLISTDLHHLIISSVVHSFYTIDVHHPFLLQDMDQALLKAIQRLFMLSLQFSFPFILVGLVLNFSLGLINKVVPQIHVFHTIMSTQVGIGLFVLLLTMSGIILGFTEFFKKEYLNFMQLG